MTIDELYEMRCRTQHNIDQHLPVLRFYAGRCRHITEFGTDIGFSTTAFLAARPKVLHCYDILRQPGFEEVLSCAPRDTLIVYHERDTLQVEIEKTDLIFFDTIHTYSHLKEEMERHAHKSRKYLIFHDIISNPEIVPAIDEYMSSHLSEWRQMEWLRNQNGLAVFGHWRLSCRG